MTKRYHAHCIRCYTLPYCRRSQPAQDEIPYEDFHQCTATTVFVDVDNAAAIPWAHNPIVSMKAKHLAIRGISIHLN